MGKPKRSRAAAPSRPGRSPVAVPVTMPVAPMAAVSVRRLPVGPGWVFEPKFDGFRALAFCGGGGVVLQSRQQRSLTDAFPDLTTTLAPLAERQERLRAVEPRLVRHRQVSVKQLVDRRVGARAAPPDDLPQEPRPGPPSNGDRTGSGGIPLVR